MNYKDRINELFNEAKEVDEFEYACTLLNFTGVQDAGWDPLQETIYVFHDLTGLLSAPIKPSTHVRLALFLYCHLTEAEAVYRILYNLLRVTQGDRYSAFPFEHLVRKFKNGDRIEPTIRKIVSEIDDYSGTHGRPEIGEMLRESVNHELRNAFYHSDYTLYNAQFRSKGSWFTHPNNVRSQVLSQDELTTIINSGVSFFQDFMHAYMKHRRSYRANKVVQGRLIYGDSYTPVTLLARRPHGLYGFESTSYDAPGIKAT